MHHYLYAELKYVEPVLYVKPLLVAPPPLDAFFYEGSGPACM